tara:strand:- start:188 stop:637 length:450 start_codon:yes stop_codon:yes gene_type:complete
MNDYFVGQLLYLVPVNKLNIIPLQIIEKITRNTINGNEVTYLAQFPNKDKTIVDVKKIKGQLYGDESNLRNMMIKNATDAIDGLILNAKNIQKEVFVMTNEQDTQIKNNNVPENTDVQVETNNDIIMVDLGNGVKAKMNTSNLDKVVNQ